MISIVILYYSSGGNTRRMANQIARGVERIPNCEAQLRTVSDYPNTNQQASTAPLISKQELRECDGLVLGSPTRFGNMAAPLKAFFDSTTDLWLSGAMVDKPAAVFTSSSSFHGGQESTLLSMSLPLLHHGMVMVGIPYTEPALSRTQRGGTPYGASHISDQNDTSPLTADERSLCTALGQRIASLAGKLAA